MKIKDPFIKKLLEEHNFQSQWGLNDYIDIFGFPFVNALKALKHMNHWRDAGAGEGKAIREYLLASSKEEVFTTAVTLKISSKINSSTHKTIVNYLEDLTQDDVRPCDILTDVEGGLQYTEQPDHLLKRYLLWLKPTGKIFIYVKPDTTFVEKAGVKLSFQDWVKGLPGLKIENGANEGALIISKEPASHAIPRLKLVETKITDNLIRMFRET